MTSWNVDAFGHAVDVDTVVVLTGSTDFFGARAAFFFAAAAFAGFDFDAAGLAGFFAGFFFDDTSITSSRR
jgi:hypothetical protein